MPRMSRVVCFRRTGRPDEVVSVEDWPVADPGPGEVLVRIGAAPVHPAHLNLLEGRYGKSPELPAVPGNEACGWVEAVGDGVSRAHLGDRVIARPPEGAWRTMCVVPERWVWPCPAGIESVQAAMVTVNPATAWRMLHDFVALESGDWILQNAANSAVGAAVIQIARAHGWRTANLVRRETVLCDVEAWGADAAAVDPEALAAAVGPGARLGLNAAGGDGAMAVAGRLRAEATLVTYGNMSRRATPLPVGEMIFRDLRLRGFWMTRWYERAPAAETDAMMAALLSLMERGALHQPVQATFSVEEAADAVRLAGEDRRSGKVLLKMAEV